jgi:hypothetical protein
LLSVELILQPRECKGTGYSCIILSSTELQE